MPTPAPGRYLRQLVSHLSRKASTEPRPDDTAVIAVHDGRCTLTCADELLVVEASAAGAAGPAPIQDVVGRHRERFGARADPRAERRSDGPALPA